jgi:serine/threonine-protein kinase RsbW
VATGAGAADRSATTVRLEIPPRRDHLALVRLVVSGAVAIDRRLAERRVEDLRLAVTEACANAVEAQLATGSTRSLEVTIELGDDLVAVTVTDHAGGFDVDALPSLPPVTDPGRLGHESGLGLALMRAHVDEITFTATADGTAVRLVVKADPSR